MKTSESITKIAPAFLKAQKEISKVLKGADNPYFKSKYADLEAVIDAVKGPLNENGLSFLQSMENGEHGPDLVTILLHESGEWFKSTTPIYTKDRHNPQALGSGITYSKRYALQALCGLPTTDDDAEAAMSRKGNGEKKEKELPALDLEKIKTPGYRKRIGSYESPAAALERIRTIFTVDEVGEAIITDIWNTETAKQAKEQVDQ